MTTQRNENALPGPGAAGVIQTGARKSFRLVLSHRDFGLLWCGQSFSAMGNQMFPVALAALVLGRQGSIGELSGVLAVQAVALVAGTLVASVLADRFRRTRLMFVADVVRFVAVAVLTIQPGMSTAGLMVLVALLGAGAGLFQPAFSALMPRIIRRDLLQPANGLNSMSQYTAQIGGPAVGGVLVGLFGAQTVLAVDAATYLLSLASLLGIRETAVITVAGRTGGLRAQVGRASADFRAGLRTLLDRPWLGWTIAMVTVVMMAAVAPALVLLPVEANARFGGERAYGAVLAAIGVGSVVGSLVASRIRTRRPGVVATVARCLNCAAMAGLALLPLPGVIATWAVAGAGVAAAEVLFVTAIQKDLPDTMLARVMALDWLGSSGLMPLGYALTAVMVDLVGTRNLLLGATVLVLVITPLPLLAKGGTTMSSSPESTPKHTSIGEE